MSDVRMRDRFLRTLVGATIGDALGAPFRGPPRSNGGAMEAVPAALAAFPNLGRTAELARVSAWVTHAHELGVEGAATRACAVSLLLQGAGDFRPDHVVKAEISIAPATRWQSWLTADLRSSRCGAHEVST